MSGLQSQGPPEVLHDQDYMRYISFGVEVSGDREVWGDCCDQETGVRTNFYADDKTSELGVVRTHAFPEVVVARYLRVRISTGLRWIGHDHKCFRFEVLGCSSLTSANSSLAARPLAPGYISVAWDQPGVSLPGSTESLLHSSHFLLNVTRVGESDAEVVIYNTSDTSLNIARPVWGAEYSLRLTCWVQGVPLHCGEVRLLAQASPSPACRAHSSFCTAERLVFLSPRRLTAIRIPETGEVRLSWVESTGGWRAPEMVLAVRETRWGERTVMETLIETGRTELSLQRVEPESGELRVLFYPRGENISPHIGQSVYRKAHTEFKHPK